MGFVPLAEQKRRKEFADQEFKNPWFQIAFKPIAGNTKMSWELTYVPAPQLLTLRCATKYQAMVEGQKMLTLLLHARDW